MDSVSKILIAISVIASSFSLACRPTSQNRSPGSANGTGSRVATVTLPDLASLIRDTGNQNLAGYIYKIRPTPDVTQNAVLPLVAVSGAKTDLFYVTDAATNADSIILNPGSWTFEAKFCGGSVVVANPPIFSCPHKPNSETEDVLFSSDKCPEGSKSVTKVLNAGPNTVSIPVCDDNGSSVTPNPAVTPSTPQPTDPAVAANVAIETDVRKTIAGFQQSSSQQKVTRTSAGVWQFPNVLDAGFKCATKDEPEVGIIIKYGTTLYAGVVKANITNQAVSSYTIYATSPTSSLVALGPQDFVCVPGVEAGNLTIGFSVVAGGGGTFSVTGNLPASCDKDTWGLGRSTGSPSAPIISLFKSSLTNQNPPLRVLTYPTAVTGPSTFESTQGTPLKLFCADLGQ